MSAPNDEHPDFTTIKLIVLDMAGTTVLDKKEVESCFADAASKTGLEMTAEEITAVQGWGKEHVFRTFWTRQEPENKEKAEDRAQHSYQVFRTILEDHYLSSPVIPTEGCLDLLEFLKARGVLTALTTGFYRKVTNIILGKLGWLDMLLADMLGKPGSVIGFSVCSDEVAGGRPSPDMIFRAMNVLKVNNPKSVINLGDTPSDLESGKNAGVFRSYGLVNGTHTLEQLEKYPNDGLFNSLADFHQFFETRL